MSDAATAATTRCCWTASTIACSSRDSGFRCLSRSARFLTRSLPSDDEATDGPAPLAVERRWLAAALVAVTMGPGGSRFDFDLAADDDLDRAEALLPLPLLAMLRDEEAAMLLPAAEEVEEELFRLLLFLLPVVGLLAVAILPLGSTLADRPRVRLELRWRVPLALRAAALCVAEVGFEAVPGEEDLVVVRPRLLLLLIPLLVRTPLDGSGGGGGSGASFSPSERYMPIDDERRAEKVGKL